MEREYSTGRGGEGWGGHNFDPENLLHVEKLSFRLAENFETISTRTRTITFERNFHQSVITPVSQSRPKCYGRDTLWRAFINYPVSAIGSAPGWVWVVSGRVCEVSVGLYLEAKIFWSTRRRLIPQLRKCKELSRKRKFTLVVVVAVVVLNAFVLYCRRIYIRARPSFPRCFLMRRIFPVFRDVRARARPVRPRALDFGPLSAEACQIRPRVLVRLSFILYMGVH